MEQAAKDQQRFTELEREIRTYATRDGLWRIHTAYCDMDVIALGGTPRELPAVLKEDHAS